MRTIVSIVAMLLLIATGQPALARQQSDLPNLTLESSRGESALSLFVEPGETVRDELRLQSNAPTEVTIAVANLTSPPNGGIIVAERDPLVAPATWLRIAGDVSFNLDDNNDRAVELAITVPDGTTPGQYLAAVTASSSTVAVEGSDLELTSRATFIVSIMVPGEQRPAFSLDAPRVEQTTTGNLLVIPIANTGNLALAPAGEITINPASGEQTTLPITLGVLLPGVSTTISVSLPAALAGEATLRLALSDAATGADSQLTDIPLTIPAAGSSESPDEASPETYAPDGEPVAVTIRDATLTPQGSPVESAFVAADIVNTGAPLGPSVLVMEVRRDGQIMETVDLVEFASVSQATLSFTFTYTPENGFSPGLWTFRLQLISVDAADEVVAQTGTIGKLDIP